MAAIINPDYQMPSNEPLHVKMKLIDKLFFGWTFWLESCFVQNFLASAYLKCFV